MNYEENRDLFIDKLGRRLTLSLFVETARCDVLVKPVFKLSEWKKTYMEIADPTEYRTALELVGDWEHWMLLRNNKTLAETYFNKWAAELEIKLRSEGICAMVDGAKNKNAVASKWLADGEFTQRDKRTKKGKEEEKKMEKGLSEKVKEDMERLGISVVGGSK